MSWEVHVTRGTYHMDVDAPPITIEEWLAYARFQPDLEVLPAPAGDPPEVIFDEGGERGEVSITWQDGRLSAWKPFERGIGRMVRIAREIGGGAHCEDDDGKRGYDEQGNFDPSKADPPEEEYQAWLARQPPEAEQPGPQLPSRPWWRFW